MSVIKKIAENLKILKEAAFKIEVEVLDGGGLPVKAHASDAGFDLFATEDITVDPGQVIKHPLNIKFNLPIGSWARVETKSGLGAKGMLVYAGVIDRGYRGVVHVICTNLNQDRTARYSDRVIVIKKGEKIAQLTLNPHAEQFYMVQVDKVDAETDRGEGGFGSSGL